jgi:hypothetical protein
MTHYRQSINEEEGEEIIWNIDYRTSSEDITNFENDTNDISVNVYRMNENNKSIVAHRLTHKQNAKYHVDLLLLTNEDGLHHYVYIKDFGRLMNSQINKTQHKKHYCRTCLHPFKSEENLLKHIENGCISCVGTTLVLPKEGITDKTKFENVNNQYEMPFRIYADFESLTRKRPHDEKQEGSFTNKIQRHEPCGFTVYVVSSVGYLQFEPITRRFDTQEEVSNEFVKVIQDIEIKLMKIIKSEERMIMTEKDKESFNQATHCHICKKELCGNSVRDHCHLTGKYRGAAHNKCNLNYNNKNIKIPVFFHNLKNYDSHLIISSADKIACKRINVIAQNSEKFITFGFDNLQFKDSYSFLSSSLDRFVQINKYKEKKGKKR